MKQKYKRMLGAFGLVIVVAVTVFAASLPAPETQAASSVTDEITVRVVGEDAGVRINQIGARNNTSNLLNINIDYEKIATLTVELYYNDGSYQENDANIPKMVLVDNLTAGYDVASSLPISFDFEAKTYTYNGTTGDLLQDFNYGAYTIRAFGYGNGGASAIAEDFFKFEYTPDKGIIIPDTGTITEPENNFMRADYLITGLVVFILIGISGFMFVYGKEDSIRKRRK